LYKNPIKFNNIPEARDEKIIFRNDNPIFKLGEEQIFGVKVKVFASKFGKFLELKSREFKIKLSVNIDKNGNINLEKDYLEYEIFSNLPHQRMKNIIEFFISLFSGFSLTLATDKLKGELNLHNRLQMLKFQIMMESCSNYDFVSENIELAEEKKFYNSSLTYYQNYLLWSYINDNRIESWGNIELDVPLDTKNLEKIIFERKHPIKLKDRDVVLVEKIIIAEIKELPKITKITKKRLKIEIEIRDV
ncbi:MAG: hypothetical protein ACRCZ9_05645, partial [Fusobacteriaceae bacterium]